jgi:hypothetical protein
MDRDRHRDWLLLLHRAAPEPIKHSMAPAPINAQPCSGVLRTVPWRYRVAAVRGGHKGLRIRVFAAARSGTCAARVIPPGTDPDALLAATLGPIIARLAETYPTVDDYVEFWQSQPAMAEWTSDAEDYVRYSLTGEPGAFRSRVNPAAVRAGSGELPATGGEIAAALRRRTRRTPLLRAPAGVFGQPPGLLPDDAAVRRQREVPALRVHTIAYANHSTNLLAPHAAAGVAMHIVLEASAG